MTGSPQIRLTPPDFHQMKDLLENSTVSKNLGVTLVHLANGEVHALDTLWKNVDLRYQSAFLLDEEDPFIWVVYKLEKIQLENMNCMQRAINRLFCCCCSYGFSSQASAMIHTADDLRFQRTAEKILVSPSR